MTRALKDGLSNLINGRGIIVEETPLKKLELPLALQQSIENKLQAEQSSQKMQFVLQKERQEATRKAIEAEGISNFQRIVSGEITEGMLRWKGMQATEKLALSTNPKIIIIGSLGNGGLPMLLNEGGK
jgi:regulator of protease activity HflC (stomatin/prohibitin superfamily)